MNLKLSVLGRLGALCVAVALAALFATGAIAMPADLTQFAAGDIAMPADLTQFAALGALGATKLVQARVLVDFRLEGLQYKCDQVIKLPDDAAKPLQANGMLDTDKGAVAYALGENGNQVLVHETEAERAAVAARTAQQAVIDDFADQVAVETDAAKKAELQASLDQAQQALIALG